VPTPPSGDEGRSADPTQAYLRQVGRVPLLTREGELDLARQRDRGEAVGKSAALATRAAGELLRKAIEEAGGYSTDEQRQLSERLVLHGHYRAAFEAGDRDAAAVAHAQLGEDVEHLPLSADAWAVLTHELDAVLATDVAQLDELQLGELEQRSGHRRDTWVGLREAIEHGRRDAKKARSDLVVANLRLVVAVARKYAHHGLPLLDLVQEGNLGLMRAAEKFDPSRGFRFSTYAIWWIRQSVTRSLADHGRTIRLPVHVVETLHKIARLRREFVAAHGREPTIEDLAERLDIPVQRVRFLSTLGIEPASLEAPIGDDGELRDVIEDESAADPVTCLHDLEMTGKLERALATLSSREERVLRLRFGIDGEDEQTLEVVGREFALTRERVRQIEAKALQKLRRPSAALV
jgi:RNA polymerase sigma factor (sigma-70 family)